MKKYLALLLAVVIAASGLRLVPRSYESQAKSVTGAIFVDQERRFNCSGTEIGHVGPDGIFLTARHCVANPETNEIGKRFQVSFSDNQGGPFYDAAPIALSLTDDVALLLIRNGATIPEVKIRDNRNLRNGDKIFNVSFPLGTGKIVFHGEYLAPSFPHPPMEILMEYPQWMYSSPVNITIAHGSSGSGIYSERDQALVGVAVGTTGEGSYNIMIPSNRVIYFLRDLKDNTPEKFQAAFPVQEAPVSFF